MSVTAAYEFTRDEGSRAGFFNSNRASTIALALLHEWQAGYTGRSFVVLDDEGSRGDEHNDKLSARLTMSEADVQQNPVDLDDLCKKHGLNRKYIGS